MKQRAWRLVKLKCEVRLVRNTETTQKLTLRLGGVLGFVWNLEGVRIGRAERNKRSGRRDNHSRSKAKHQKLTTYHSEFLAAFVQGKSGSYHATLQEGRSGQSSAQVPY